MSGQFRKSHPLGERNKAAFINVTKERKVTERYICNVFVTCSRSHDQITTKITLPLMHLPLFLFQTRLIKTNECQ